MVGGPAVLGQGGEGREMVSISELCHNGQRWPPSLNYVIMDGDGLISELRHNGRDLLIVCVNLLEYDG